MRRSVSTQLKVAAFIAISLFSCAISRAQQASSQVIARAKNAVVIVTTYDARGKARAQGSGFFIDQHTIVTNAHVIREAASIRIVLLQIELIDCFDPTIPSSPNM